MNCRYRGMNANKIEEIQEDIEESLDDLLIFPTKEGLRITTHMITSYFQLEVETMKQYNGTKISDQQYESIVSDQETVVDIATRELNGGKAHKKKSESC